MAAAAVMRASRRATRVTAAPAAALMSLPREIRDSVLGICGDRLEHFTIKWSGTNRYSWVFAFHQTISEKMG